MGTLPGGRPETIFTQGVSLDDLGEEALTEVKENVKQEILELVTKELETVSRYFQFRMRTVLNKGLPLSHAYRLEYDDNKVTLVLSVEIRDELLSEISEELLRLLRKARKENRRSMSREKRRFSDEEHIRSKPDGNNRG